MHRLSVLLLLSALAACSAPTEWSRPNTSAEQRLADERACAGIASYQAFDESFASKPKYPPFNETQFTLSGGSGGEGNSDGGLTTSYSRRGAREYEFVDHCMRERGYGLIPKTVK